MRILVYVILFLSVFHVNAKQSIVELQQRYHQLSVKNKVFSSSILLPELKDFLSQEPEDKDVILALQIIAEIYLQYDAYAESFSSLEKAYKLSTALSPVIRASVILSQAELSLALAKHDDAIYKINKALQILQNHNGTLYAKALLIKGRIYQRLGSFRQAVSFFSQVKTVALNEPVFLILASLYSAQISLEQGELIQAELHLKAIDKKDVQLVSEKKQLEYKTTLVRLEMQKGHFTTSVRQASKLLEYTVGTRFLSLQASLQDIMSKSFLQQGNYQKAFVHLQRFTLTQNAIALKKRTNKLLQLEIINNISQNKQRILMLEKEALLAAAELKQKESEKNQFSIEQRRKIWQWQFLMVLIVVFSFIAYNFWQKKKTLKLLELQVADRVKELKEKNKMLEKLSNTDSLTSLYNRHYLHSIINTELANVRRNFFEVSDGHYLVTMLIDIDFFKQVNDSYGHFAGDNVLKELGELLKENLRESDYLIRWGGEEFLVILRDFNLSDVPQFAEQLRNKVEQKLIHIDTDKSLNITCSIGYAHYPFMVGDIKAYNWQHVMELADIALYIAKDNGRNAWVGISGEDVRTAPEELIKNIGKSVAQGEVNLSTNITAPIKIK